MKYKIKISTYDNQPLARFSAEKFEDFDPIMKTLKRKFGGKDGKL